MIEHNLQPLFNKDSEILILGSFPSVKSRIQEFYYGNPLNRFWKVLSLVYNKEEPSDITSKKDFILNNKIALWDVIKECDIKGSDDSTIENVIPNDLSIILNHCHIKQIYCNGNKSYTLYMKYIYPVNNIKPIKLPSTSPANAAWSVERLVNEWKIIKEN